MQHPPAADHVLEELRNGSSVALVKTARMITGLLVEYRAYDFEDRWGVFIQGVIGRLLSEPWIAPGQIETQLRRATLDDLGRTLRRAASWKLDGELPWCESSHMRDRTIPDAREGVEQFAREIAKLPEQRAQVLRDVFGEGRSFDQVAAQRKIPLRMVKRFLRESIWDLRECCGQHRSRQSDTDERVKSCLRSLELDLPAFLVEPHLDEWRDFRRHYPVCHDCAAVVANWSRVEAMVREACGASDRHPSAEELIALHRDGEGLAYTQYVALMRHLDGCPPCSEAMTLLARFDRRPIAESLIRQAERGRSAEGRSPLGRWLGRVRSAFSP